MQAFRHALSPLPTRRAWFGQRVAVFVAVEQVGFYSIRAMSHRLFRSLPSEMHPGRSRYSIANPPPSATASGRIVNGWERTSSLSIFMIQILNSPVAQISSHSCHEFAALDTRFRRYHKRYHEAPQPGDSHNASSDTTGRRVKIWNRLLYSWFMFGSPVLHRHHRHHHHTHVVRRAGF